MIELNLYKSYFKSPQTCIMSGFLLPAQILFFSLYREICKKKQNNLLLTNVVDRDYGDKKKLQYFLD